MPYFATPIIDLIENLARFPGIGEKSAEKFAFFLLKSDSDYIDRLIKSIINIRSSITLCKICFNYTEKNPCSICSDLNRDNSICVVKDPSDLSIIEKSGGYRGKYHVLGGLLSPLSGINPSKLKIEDLKNRIRKTIVDEIIIALSSSVEGEATSLYIKKLLEGYNIKISIIASGIPVGSNLEYIDDLTLRRAFESRVEFK